MHLTCTTVCPCIVRLKTQYNHMGSSVHSYHQQAWLVRSRFRDGVDNAKSTMMWRLDHQSNTRFIFDSSQAFQSHHSPSISFVHYFLIYEPCCFLHTSTPLTIRHASDPDRRYHSRLYASLTIRDVSGISPQFCIFLEKTQTLLTLKSHHLDCTHK